MKPQCPVISLCLLVATCGLELAYADCVLAPPGLIAWWRGENNALDQVGNHHGSLQNGVTFTAGKVGQAFQFDGTNDLVDLGGNSPLRRTDAITYAFWANLPADGGGLALGVGAAGGQGFGGVYLDRTNFYFTWTPSAPNSDANLVALGVSLPADQWIHFAIAVNYMNQVGAIYVNGQAFPSVVTNLIGQPLANWLPNGQYNVGRNDSIGGRFVNTQQFFKGQLEEVDLYARALSAAEIHAIFNAGSAGKCGVPTLSITPLPGAVRLTWTTNAPGYRLETNSALTFPAGWGVLASNYSVLNTHFAVTNTVGDATRFYRLHKP